MNSSVSAILAIAAACAASPQAGPVDPEKIPAWTLTLERRSQPWCLSGCAKTVPLAAVYVLVVYGGSHWTTLSQALEKRMGKPRITPFLE